MDKEKMVIRSVTYTIDLDKVDNDKYLKYVENNIVNIKNAFSKKNIKIRTIRFNILSISDLSLEKENELLEKVALLSLFTEKIGLRWFNISFDLIDSSKNEIDRICNLSIQILKNYENSFINLIIAKEYINNYAAYKGAETIKKVSKLSANGIDNFRLGISLNIQPNTPFFPFSYSDNNDSFSIAVETTSTDRKSVV